VRFPNLLVEVAALEKIPECYFAQHLLACFHYSRRHYEKATQLWHRCVEMAPDFADAWRGLAIHAWNKQVMPTWRQRIWRKPAPDSRRMRVCFLNATCWIS
jgi:hypothetical protein